ncbi:MAG TPA: ATP synthase F1 subunit epsilon [Candidatus Marinimicrobia bacterium]|nr:ATP synthase F1 subunit epsilon [Candidatus Neomarinimicrobiota bacterium]
MSTFSLELVTPTKVLDEGQVEHIRCPGLDGYFGVMANHRDAIIALGIGEVKVTQNKKDHYLAVSGGFAEITKGTVELLLETFERVEEIDAARAKSSRQRAQDRKEVKEIDTARNEASLLRALNRLKILKR